MTPKFDFEVFFRFGDAGFLRGVTHSGGRSPLQVLALLWDPELLLGFPLPVEVVLPLVTLGFAALTPPKRSPDYDPLAYSVLRGRRFACPSPGLGTPLEVSSR